MGNLFDLLHGHLDENVVDHLSNQIGGADRQQTATAAQSIVSTLLAGLAKNASTPEGAASLSNPFGSNRYDRKAACGDPCGAYAK